MIRRSGRSLFLIVAVLIVLVAIVVIMARMVVLPVLLPSLHRSATLAQSAPDINATTRESFYSQEIEWSACDRERITLSGVRVNPNMSEYQCATLKAPLDWDEPGGEQITLSLAVHRSGAAGAPMLFYNLGGPGAQAVRSLSYQIEENLGDALVDHYDIVALDPRGVGGSTPVTCMTDEQKDSYTAHGSPIEGAAANAESMTPQQIVDAADERADAIADGCRRLSGSLFEHIDTVSAATDFDMVRAVLGQGELHYLGFSYGTFLGATYAELFPDRVGHFVLDGAIDPAMNVNDVSDLQMRGFEEAMGHWVDVCLNEADCPLSGTHADGVAQVSDFLSSLTGVPLDTSDPQRPLTQNLALTAMTGMLYSEQSYPLLKQALAQAVTHGDGSQLLMIADYVNDRNDDGTYSSSTDALIAINNLDYGPVGTIDEWTKNADALKKELTVFGGFAGYTSAGLGRWPTSHAPRRPISASGAAPIVVIGTTHDPATPYVMAVNLAAQLSSGALVTNEGWDHTAYSKVANPCVRGAVETYLVDGSVPEQGLMCGQ